MNKKPKQTLDQQMEEAHRAIHGDDLNDDCVFGPAGLFPVEKLTEKEKNMVLSALVETRNRTYYGLTDVQELYTQLMLKLERIWDESDR